MPKVLEMCHFSVKRVGKRARQRKNRMTNQLASLARRDYFYLDAFSRVNLGMYMTICKFCESTYYQPIRLLRVFLLMTDEHGEFQFFEMFSGVCGCDCIVVVRRKVDFVLLQSQADFCSIFYQLILNSYAAF